VTLFGGKLLKRGILYLTFERGILLIPDPRGWRLYYGMCNISISARVVLYGAIALDGAYRKGKHGRKNIKEA